MGISQLLVSNVQEAAGPWLPLPLKSALRNSTWTKKSPMAFCEQKHEDNLPQHAYNAHYRSAILFNEATNDYWNKKDFLNDYSDHSHESFVTTEPFILAIYFHRKPQQRDKQTKTTYFTNNTDKEDHVHVTLDQDPKCGRVMVTTEGHCINFLPQ